MRFANLRTKLTFIKSKWIQLKDKQIDKATSILTLMAIFISKAVTQNNSKTGDYKKNKTYLKKAESTVY